MNVEDLMIGDWVLDTRINIPVQVNPFMAEMEVPEWEPIPLTEEILEKNGFERDKNISLYNAYTGINSRVTLHDDFMSMNSRNMWDVHVDSEDFCTIANCELTFIHQLQQLLRLCKIYKEILV